MNWQDQVTVDPRTMTGKPVIRGTRIAVEFVIDLLERGYSREQIIQQYPHLTEKNIQACLAYAKELLQTERVYPVSL